MEIATNEDEGEQVREYRLNSSEDFVRKISKGVVVASNQLAITLRRTGNITLRWTSCTRCIFWTACGRCSMSMCVSGPREGGKMQSADPDDWPTYAYGSLLGSASPVDSMSWESQPGTPLSVGWLEHGAGARSHAYMQEVGRYPGVG